MEQITLRIPEELLKSLEDEADEHNKSRSKHIRDILHGHVETGANTADTATNTDTGMNALEERALRLEVERDQLEKEVERLRDDRDQLQARYHEAQGKLKVHHSEQDGLLSLAKDWLLK